MSNGKIYVLPRAQHHQQQSGPGYSWPLPTRSDFPNFNGYMIPNPPRQPRAMTQQTPDCERRLEHRLRHAGRGAHAGNRGGGGQGHQRGRGKRHHQNHRGSRGDHAAGCSGGIPQGDRYRTRAQWQHEQDQPHQPARFIPPPPSTPGSSTYETRLGFDRDAVGRDQQQGPRFDPSFSGVLKLNRVVPGLWNDGEQRHNRRQQHHESEGIVALMRPNDTATVQKTNAREAHDVTSDTISRAPASQSQELIVRPSDKRSAIAPQEQVQILQECIRTSAMLLDLDQCHADTETPFWEAVWSKLPNSTKERFSDNAQLRKSVTAWTNNRKNMLIKGCLEPPRDKRVEIDDAVDRWNRISCKRFCLVNKRLIDIGLWSAVEEKVRSMVSDSVHKSLSEEMNRTINHLKKSGDWHLSEEKAAYIDALAKSWRGLAPHLLRKGKAVIELLESLQTSVGQIMQDEMNDGTRRQSQRLRSRRNPSPLVESDAAVTSMSDLDAPTQTHNQGSRESSCPMADRTPGQVMDSVEVKCQSVSRSPSPPISPGTSCRVYKNGIWSIYEAPDVRADTIGGEDVSAETPSRKRGLSREAETPATPESSGAKRAKQHDKTVQRSSQSWETDDGATLTTGKSNKQRAELLRNQVAVMSGANGIVPLSPSFNNTGRSSEDTEANEEASSPINASEHNSRESTMSPEKSSRRQHKKYRKKDTGDAITESETASGKKKRTKRSDPDVAADTDGLVDDLIAPPTKKAKKSRRARVGESEEHDGVPRSAQGKKFKKKKHKSPRDPNAQAVIEIDNSDEDEGDAASSNIGRSRESTYFPSLDEIFQSQPKTSSQQKEHVDVDADIRASLKRQMSRNSVKAGAAKSARLASIRDGTAASTSAPDTNLPTSRYDTPASSNGLMLQAGKGKARDELGNHVRRTSGTGNDRSPSLPPGNVELALRGKSRGATASNRESTVDRFKDMPETEHRAVVYEMFKDVKELKEALKEALATKK